MFTRGSKLSKFTAKLATVALATAALLSAQLIQSTPAQAADVITTEVSPSSVAPGGKLNLVTTMPQVSATNTAMQEIIQTIDPTKVSLGSAADVVVPAGWVTNFSQDGGLTWLSTPTDWSAVNRVKATGPLNSGGLTQQGNQIVSRSVPIVERASTLNAAAGSGDGYDVAIDTRGYLFNTYHHSSPAAIDCRLMATGASCNAAKWPFSVAGLGMGTSNNSTQFVDQVNNHLWAPNADSSGIGFLCIDIKDVTNPVLCGGSKANAWHPLSTSSTAVDNIGGVVAANGMLFSWDIVGKKLLCFNYLANKGDGAPCASDLPTTSRVTAATNTAWGAYYSRVMVYKGLVFGHQGQTVVCVDSRTLGLCPGWTAGDLKFSAAVEKMWVQPAAGGFSEAVCFAPQGKCFDTAGADVRVNSVMNTVVQAASAFSNNPVTSGSRVLWGSWASNNLWCFDYSNTSTATGVGGRCSGFTDGTNVSSKSIPTIYTAQIDPTNPNCLWTNGDNGIITPVEISSGATGCAQPPTRVTFSGEMIVPRMTCDASSGIIQWRDFVMSGVTKDVDYTGATLSVLDASGAPVVSNGRTWQNVPFDNNSTVDLSGMSSDHVGDTPTFVIDFASRGTTTAPIGKISVISAPAQMCLTLTAKTNLPAGFIYQAGSNQTAGFSAIGSTTVGNNPAVNYAPATTSATITPVTAAQYGSLVSGTVTNGLSGTGLRAIAGAEVTLTSSAGVDLVGPNNQIIRTTTDATGSFSFGIVLAGSYKLRFSDLPALNSIGTGDARSVTVAGGTAATATVNFATQSSLLSNLFTVGLDTPVPVVAVYHLPGNAVNDSLNVAFNSGVGTVTALNVLANDLPYTASSWNLASIKIANASNTYVAPTTVGTGVPAVVNGTTVGTYYVNTTSGSVMFAPTTGYTGTVPPISYQITSVATGPGASTGTFTAVVSPTVLAGPTVGADTMIGDFAELPTVNAVDNDSAASGTTLDLSTFKLCALVGTKTVASITATGDGTTQTYTSAADHGLFTGQFVTVNGLTGTDASKFNVVRTKITVTGARTFTIAGTGITANVTGTASLTGIQPADCSLTSVLVTSKGTYAAASDGTVTFTPVSGWSGVADSVTYMVRDSLGAPSFGTAQATVLAVPPVINTTNLTAGQINVAYSLTLSGTAGSATMKSAPWSVVGLPAGLTFNATNGVISGTPTVSGTFPISVTYTASDNRRAIQSYSLTIGQPPVITDANTGANAFTVATPCVLGDPCQYVTNFTAGTAAIPATGAWSITAGAANLATSGLTLNPDTGVISGTVRVADFAGFGYFNITIKVTDSNGLSDTHNVRLVFHTPPVITTAPTDGTVGIALTQNNTYTRGYSYGLYWIDAPTSGVPWSVTGLPDGITIDRATGVMSGTPTRAGSFPMVITLVDDQGDVVTKNVTWVIKARPAVATSTLGNVAQGLAMSPITLQATLGTATALKASAAWTATGLPAGLSINTTTGVISGTPTAAVGVYPVVITVTDSASLTSVARTVNVTVVLPSAVTTPSPIQLVTDVPISPINQTYTLSPNATLPITGAWSATGLPAGLSINTSTGQITGTVSVGGAYNVVVSMVDSLGVRVSKTIRLNVIEAPEILTPTNLAPLVAGTAMGTAPNTSLTLDVMPGTANLVSFTLADGTTLPTGLALNSSTGAITGTPTLPAGSTGVSTTFKVTVTDGNNLTDTNTFTVWVGIAPVWTSTTIPDAITDTITGRVAGANITLVQNAPMAPYNQALPVNLDVTPDNAVTSGTFTVSSGTLPAGLVMNPTTGVISGTPTGAAATNYTFGVKFTDANGLVSSEKSYVVNLVAPPVVTTVNPPVWRKDVAITSFSQTKTNGTSTVAAATNPWSISPALPAGLTFNQTTGAITGTPTAAADGDFTVSYTDSYGLTATKVIKVVVAVAPAITTAGTAAAAAVTMPNAAVNRAIATVNQTTVRGTGTIPATGAWSVKSGSTIPAGLWLNPNTGSLMGTPQTAGVYAFTLVVTDSYGLTAEKVFNLTVFNPPTVTTSSIPFVIANTAIPTSSTGTVNSTHYKLAASAGAGATIPTTGTVWAATGLPAGLTLNAATGQLTGTPTIAGIYPVTYTVTDSNSMTASRVINFTVVAPPTIVTDGPLVIGRSIPVEDVTLASRPGTFPLVSSSVWSVVGTPALPAGLSLNADTGAITGTTTATAGDVAVTFRIVDTLGVATTKQIVLRVRDLPTITTGAAPMAAVGVPVTYPQTATAPSGATIPATGAWSADHLPAGLTINRDTGVVSGTPTQAGEFVMTIMVTDSNGLVGTKDLTIEVGLPPKITTNKVLSAGFTTRAYEESQEFDAGTSGLIPDTGAWSLVSGTLPTGIALDTATGDLVGTPTAVGTFRFTVKLTNENGFFDTEELTIMVLAAGSNLTIFNLPDDVLDGISVTPLPIDLTLLASSAAGLAVSFGTDTPSVCFTNSEGDLTIIAAGTCKVWASSGTGNQLSKVTQSFVASKANQAITVVPPTATDSPLGFKLQTTVSSGLSPVYEVIAPATGEPSCTIEEDGTVTWQADLVGPPAPAPAAFKCKVRITQPGDAGYNAAVPVEIELTATHVDVVVPDGYVQNDPAVTTGLPRTGGTVMKGGVGFIVAIDAKKKSFTVKPISRGLYIGPITAEITIEYKLAGVTKTQTCNTVFGVSALDAKKKPITDRSKETAASIAAVTKPYVAMMKAGKKYGPKGFLSAKSFTNSVVCPLNKDAYAYFTSGAAIKATAMVTRDRRWPTTYARAKPNGFVITPTRVLWNLSIG